MVTHATILAIESLLGQKLPQFYVDFLVAENLLDSRIFDQKLTMLYGIEQLADHQEQCARYLPGYLKIGDNGGTHAIFIKTKPPASEAIFLCNVGDLDEISLDKVAETLNDWKNRDYDTELFLLVQYENKFESPLLQIQAPIREFELQIKALSRRLSEKEIELKEYLLRKREVEIKLHALKTKQTTLSDSARLVQATGVSLSVTEQRFGVRFPVLYKKIEADGMLTYSADFGPDWYKKKFAMLKSQPPFLLFAKGLELVSTRELYLNTRGDNQSWNRAEWDANFKMLPFAGDGSGDQFAFWLSCPQPPSEPNDWPIIHWWHDDTHFDVKAKNLEDFIFIKLLDLALEIEIGYDLVADGEIQENLQNMLSTHRRYISQRRTDLLAGLYARLPKKNGDCIWFIDVSEYKAIRKQELGYEQDLGRFKYHLET